jgi:hypothetical protein
LKTSKAQKEKSKTKRVLSQKKFQTSKISCVGNFIKPKPSIHLIGAEPEAASSDKPEKGRRGHNDCKRHWPSLARLVSWCPVCILWWTVHSRPWRRIDIMEIIVHHRQKNNNSHPRVAAPYSSCNAASEIRPVLTNRTLNR